MTNLVGAFLALLIVATASIEVALVVGGGSLVAYGLLNCPRSPGPGSTPSASPTTSGPR